MKDWAELVGMAVGLVLLVVMVGAIALFLGFWVLLFLGIALSVAILTWMVGVPVTIKRNGKKVGYLRWFTFHEVKNDDSCTS